MPGSRIVRGGARGLLATVAIGTGASLLALLAARGPWIGLYELRSMDLMMRLRGAAPADPRVVVCDIDAAGVDRFGQWPWPRPVLATLVDRLSAAGAAVIAFDIVFAEPARAGAEEDRVLAESLKRSGIAVLGYYFRREKVSEEPALYGGDPANIQDSAIEQVIEPAGGFPLPDRPEVEPNIDLLAAAAASQGFFSIDPDPDGVLRHYAVLSRHGDGFYPALAVRAVQKGLNAGPLMLAPRQGRLPSLTIAGRPVPTDEAGRLWVNYRGPAGVFTTIPARQVIENRFDPEAVRGRLVFIGASETGIADLRATPLAGVVPGVEVHATVADNLLNGRFIHDTAVHLALSLTALLLIGPLVGLLVSAVPRAFPAFLLSAAAAGGWLAATWIAFTRFNGHLLIVAPFLAAVLAYVGGSVYRAVFVEAKARQIKKTFERYVSGAIVEEMLADPDRVKLGGERREMTVLFSDIRGFTSLSEKLEPEQVARLLNGFLTPMTRVVLETGGTLDKYMGDALMAFFGAPTVQPDHAARACRAALRMREELARLNEAWEREGLLKGFGGRLGIGIGLNSGWMSVGNMGSEEIFDYTVIGDNVNLGSRLEALNRAYGTEVLVSEFTAAQVSGDLLLREIDRVRVKGKQQPVTIYELVGPAPADAVARARLEGFASGLAAYRGRDFRAAGEIFARLLAENGADGPARIYLDRCQTLLLSPPPADWDAVETLTAK
ncbi:MAG TPA: adenylate/guanylate cyclase domain-containing protein [Candidatus Cryosericum sp.]|nr:adenylate/guanylate cyclase domain-containing protein [Candidatus Cryosericum sp.]